MLLLAVTLFLIAHSVPFMDAQAQTPKDDMWEDTPKVRFQTESEYLQEFPLLVSVTVFNPTENVTYRALPRASIFDTTGPYGFKLVNEKGDVIRLEAASPRGEEGLPSGFTLRPGESRTNLVDLTNYRQFIESGNYEIHLEYVLREDVVKAPPRHISVGEPSLEDQNLTSLLRGLSDAEASSWNSFLIDNWRTIYTRRPAPREEVAEGRAVDASELSEEGREALALHLFLHRATYGPKGVAELTPNDTQAFARGPLEGEAAVLRYEILAARDDPSVKKERQKILEQFPGLKWRIEAIENGDGRLMRLRRMYGAEQDFTTEPEFFPYTEQ